MLTWLMTLCKEIYCELLIMRSTSIFYAMGRKIGFFGFLQKINIENSLIYLSFYSKEKYLGIMGFFLLVSLVKKNTTAKHFLNQNFSIENNNPFIYLFNRPYRWSFSLFFLCLQRIHIYTYVMKKTENQLF